MARLMTVSDYARYRKANGLPGGTHQGVTKAISRGRISLTADGMVDVDEANAQWTANTRRRVDYYAGEAPEVASDGDAPAIDRPAPRGAEWAASKARTEAALADIKEMQAAKMRGELVDRSGVERGAYQSGRQIQKAIVDLFPSRVAVDGAAITEPWAFECWLRDQLRGELLALASDMIRIES